jgi:hypothetical protein
MSPPSVAVVGSVLRERSCVILKNSIATVDGAVAEGPIEQFCTFGAPSSEEHFFGPPLSKLLNFPVSQLCLVSS